jgi:trehalose 6-phosphate synthase/phosphatase
MSPRPGPPPAPVAPAPPLLARLRAAPALALLLDYDGTLVPLAPTPELATPDAALRALLDALARRPATRVDVVSGRPRAVLERWLGGLPIGLHAEHGFWTRGPGAPAWTPAAPVDAGWRAAALAVLGDVTARTPGALVEEKTAGVAWHYRLVEPETAARALDELRAALRPTLGGHPLEILAGDKVLEVRPRGVHKGALVASILAAAPPGALPVAFGDDVTDEDLFAALPAGSVAIHVGAGPSRAPHRLPGPGDVRALLAGLLDGPAPGPGPA